jgi:hypothetical protein
MTQATAVVKHRRSYVPGPFLYLWSQVSIGSPVLQKGRELVGSSPERVDALAKPLEQGNLLLVGVVGEVGTEVLKQARFVTPYRVIELAPRIGYVVLRDWFSRQGRYVCERLLYRGALSRIQERFELGKHFATKTVHIYRMVLRDRYGGKDGGIVPLGFSRDPYARHSPVIPVWPNL